MRRWLTYANRTLLVLLITGSFVALAITASAQQDVSAYSQPAQSQLLDIADDDLLVLEVRLDTKSTGHGLIAYQHQDMVLLPLGELSSILELAIMIDPQLGTASGWIVEEDRTFELNLTTGTITRKGDQQPLPAGMAACDEDDIYIVSTLIEQWLPIDLEINLPRMHIKISPRETLPFQSRLKRDEQRSLWLASQGKATMNYPMQKAPYRMWSWPLIDATAGFYTGRQNTTRRLSLQSYADIAGVSANLFVSHTGNEFRNKTVARLKAGRWNPEGQLLGPAAATKYEFGDLFISRIPLISTSKQGVGMTISNQSLNRSREFDTTDVHGDAPPGWEAELYINGSLYDFQTIGENGQYLFTEVPLIVGNNIFRTVLYGPQGNTREVVRNANISPEMSEVGKLKYRVTFLKEGSGMLTPTPTRADSLASAWNQQLELAYAPSHKHALVANFSRLNVEGKQEFFSSLTSHNSFGLIYLETIIAKSMRGGAAGSIGARSKYRGHNLFALYNVNDNYRAEALYDRSYLNRQAILRSSGNLLSLGTQKLFYNLSATKRHFAENRLQQEQEVKFHLSTGINRLLLSHSLRYRKRQYDTYDDDVTLGSQLVRTQLGPFSIRADFNYDINPTHLRSVGTSINWFRTNNLRISMRAAHFLKPEFGNDNVTADLTKYFENLSLGINFSHFKTGGSAFGVTLGTFLARDIRSSCWTVQHRPLSSRSMASVRAFIDLNANKIFDEGDEPLPDLGFHNLTAWRKIRTNSDGIALLPGLLVHRAQTIELNLSTVSDPFLVPLSKGVNVVGHPGSFAVVEFPFSYIGEMEGRILEADTMESPVRHVGLEILDSEGNRVKSTVGEFDGFYYFSNIFPGDYTLSVIPSTINKSKFDLPQPVPFTIPGEGGFITGPDIVLERKTYRPDSRPVIAAVEPPLNTTETDGKQLGEDIAVTIKSPDVPDPVTLPQDTSLAAATKPVNTAAGETNQTLSEDNLDVASTNESLVDAAGVKETDVVAITPIETEVASLPQPKTEGAGKTTPTPDNTEIAAVEQSVPETQAAPAKQVDSTTAGSVTSPSASSTQTAVAAAGNAASLPLDAQSVVALPVESEKPKLATVPNFDEKLALSLIFEILYQNSLWPDEPVQ